MAATSPPPPSRFRPGLDARLDAICLQALAKQPADRFSSMRAFADALAALESATVSPLIGPRLTLRITGTPSQAGIFSFTITAALGGCAGQRSYSTVTAFARLRGLSTS